MNRHEIAKQYLDMVERHHKEALELVKNFDRIVTFEDETLFYRISYYSTELNTMKEIAKVVVDEIVNE